MRGCNTYSTYSYRLRPLRLDVCAKQTVGTQLEDQDNKVITLLSGGMRACESPHTFRNRLSAVPEDWYINIVHPGTMRTAHFDRMSFGFNPTNNQVINN